MLALVQCQQRGIEPGPLATFPGWKAKGRHVKKGERALTLCMPITVRNREKQSESETDPDAFTLFVYKPRWFVLSQTEGEPVTPPDIPQWSKGRALAALGIEEVPFDLTDGNTQGFARKRQVAVSPLAAVPHETLFHELAHVTLGHTAESDFSDSEHTPRSLCEVEAEAVALICCEALRLPGADFCRGYIQNWNAAGQPIPEHSAQKVFRAADRILKAGAPPSGPDAD